MYKLQKYVDASGLEHSLLELIKTRVSQTKRLRLLSRPQQF
jgi:hypothetical protein